MSAKESNGTTLVGMAAVAVACLIAIAFSMRFGAAETADAARGPQPADVEVASRVVPSLANAARAGDRLPSYLRSGEQQFDGLDPASTRRLGQSEGVRYWSGVDDQGQICMVAVLPGGNRFASMTCSPTARVMDKALYLQIGDKTVSQRAVLVPDGYVADAPSFKAVSPRLLISDATKPQPEFTLRSDSMKVADRSAIRVDSIPALRSAEG